MTIYFATDHAGFALKETLCAYVRDVLGHHVEDCGAYEYVPTDDYPDYIRVATHEVAKHPETSRAIILGGSGQGEAMVANRTPHVRATVYYGGPLEIITLSRAHNDANILSLGARFLTVEEAQNAVKIWLETPFSGEARHKNRITKF